jgi:hypothetical protein
MPWAALLMCAGFATREAAAFDTDNLGYLIASTVLIMSGPPVYAAINYFVLSRIMFYVPWLVPIHPGRVVFTFLGIDGIIEILIGNGASRLANASAEPSVRETGDRMVKASLCVQAVMFIVFLSFSAYLHRKANAVGAMPYSGRLSKVMYALYISSVVVLVRCIYRLVEYFEGWGGYLNTHEPFFWVFDATLMLINTVFLNIWHPGARLPPSNETFLSPDGITVLTGPGWVDRRGLLRKLFDPFDIVGIVRKDDKKTKFWEMSSEELEEYTLRVKEEDKKFKWV